MPILRLGTLDAAGGKDAGEALLVRAVHLVLGAATGRRREKIGKTGCTPMDRLEFANLYTTYSSTMVLNVSVQMARFRHLPSWPKST